MAIPTIIASPLSSLRGFAASLGWGPLVQLSRSAIVSVLNGIERGRLVIVDTNNKEIVFGNNVNLNDVPSVELHVHNDTFWVRMLLFADMGFAESYMLGEIDCTDLTSFFELFILNRSQLSNGSTIISSLSGTVSGLARRANTLTNARLNIAAHYDISNDMFAAFLSPDMTYSCPVWLPTSNPQSPFDTLEDAQIRKLRLFISETRLKSTDHVLEIGTGWGSFAILAVKETGCQVTSVTLSVEQKELAEQRIQEEGLQGKIKVLLRDYRDLEELGPFDKIVSIEMLEAVGREFLDTYFSCVDKLLKRDGGIAAFQCITIPETRYEAYHRSTDFIRAYIFPGGHLPSVTKLTSAINNGSSDRLTISSIKNIGPHYAKTLRLWREKFLENFDDRIKPALLRDHGGMSKADLEVWCRKWHFYFTYCEAAFRTNTLGDVVITVAREGAMECMEDIPL